MIHSVGLVRKVDGLGRVVIPRELRTQFGIEEDDELKFGFKRGEYITIRKSGTVCHLCGKSGKMTKLGNSKFICSDCVAEVKKVPK